MDLEAWLNAHDIDLGPQRRRRLSKVSAILDDRYDDDGPRLAALLAAAKYLAGEIDPTTQGKTLARARARATEQLAAARIVTELAIGDGAAEATTARQVGVDRMAVRKWRGKKE